MRPSNYKHLFFFAASETFIRGTKVIKKNNVRDHINKSRTHNTAVRRLGEIRKESSLSSHQSTSSCSGVPKQATILTHMQKLSTRHHNQLTKKFQIAHFITSHGKGFNFYSNLAHFERTFHNVDLGESYVSDTACAEIVKYISKSIKIKRIEPLNNGEGHYYSVMNDGSSSAKTMDEKELFLIKTAFSGAPKFSIMSLEEVEDANAEGLKVALEKSLSKLMLTKERKLQEIGMCTDGAPVNVRMHRMIREELGDHHQLILCPAHKLELAIHDAFKTVPLNAECEKDSVNIYYYFKRANLKWRLFKRQAIFMEHKLFKYKRPTGTRWVEHQMDALESSFKNLPIFLGFANQQTVDPYNQQMKDSKAKLQGLLADNSKIKNIVFNAIKVDILSVLRPVSHILQESNLLVPELITVCTTAVKTVKKMRKFVETHENPFENAEFFPTLNKFIEQLEEEDEELLPYRQTRNDAGANPGGLKFTFHGYLLTGDLNRAKEACKNLFSEILAALEEALTDRLDSIIEDPLYKSIAAFLDTRCYQFADVQEILSHVDKIKETFRVLLLGNNCDITKLKSETEIIFNHVKNFASARSPSKTWPMFFSLKNELGITNVMHIAEISIALPICNAESERVFSFLWRAFSKDRQSLKNDTLEDILRLRSDMDFKADRYDHAIEMFLAEYPNGEVRKRARRLDGHNYPEKRKSCGKKKIGVNVDLLCSTISSSSEDEAEVIQSIQSININEISDDEWSESEEEP